MERPEIERAVKSADHQEEQQQHRPDPAQGLHFLAEAEAPAGRTGRRIAEDRDLNRHHIENDAEDAGNDAGDEQLADRGFGEQAVDHQDDRRRNQDPQRSAGGDRGRGQLIGIAELAHFRHHHLGHGGGGGERRAADGGKAATGGNGGHGEATAEMAEKGVGDLVELTADAALVDEQAHQDEQGHHRKPVILAGIDDQPRHKRDCRREIGFIGHAGHADDSHGEGNGHPQQHQKQHCGKTDDGFNHVRLGEGLA